jgi:hypothetical protein
VSRGYSADQTGQAVVQQGVGLFPLLASPPDAPLVAASVIDLSGTIELVANPNGGGPGVAMSVWSDSAVTIGSSAVTCQLGEYLWSGTPYDEDGIPKCDTNSCRCSNADETGILSSNAVGEGSDIVDEATSFPPDLFAYVFGFSRDSWQEVYQDAQIYDGADCDQLGPTSSGVIWLQTNNCSLPATEIGSVDDPVLLVVDDVRLTFNSNTEVYGLIFIFDKDDSGTGADMKINGTAQLYGAIVAEGADLTNGTLIVRYERSVLENISRTGRSQAIAKIPASWRPRSDI